MIQPMLGIATETMVDPMKCVWRVLWFPGWYLAPGSEKLKLDQGEIVVALEIELLLPGLLLKATNCEGLHHCTKIKSNLVDDA
jgi:hypothetical protein